MRRPATCWSRTIWRNSTGTSATASAPASVSRARSKQSRSIRTLVRPLWPLTPTGTRKPRRLTVWSGSGLPTGRRTSRPKSNSRAASTTAFRSTIRTCRKLDFLFRVRCQRGPRQAFQPAGARCISAPSVAAIPTFFRPIRSMATWVRPTPIRTTN